LGAGGAATGFRAWRSRTGRQVQRSPRSVSQGTRASSGVTAPGIEIRQRLQTWASSRSEGAGSAVHCGHRHTPVGAGAWYPASSIDFTSPGDCLAADAGLRTKDSLGLPPATSDHAGQDLFGRSGGQEGGPPGLLLARQTGTAQGTRAKPIRIAGAAWSRELSNSGRPDNQGGRRGAACVPRHPGQLVGQTVAVVLGCKRPIRRRWMLPAVPTGRACHVGLRPQRV